MSNNDHYKTSWDKDITDVDPEEWISLGSVSGAMEETFQKYSFKVALIYQGVEITFKELDQYSNQFANMLLENGLEYGDAVAINLPNIPEYVIAILGTLRAGCVVSGVSILLKEVQIQYQLSDIAEAGKKVALITLDSLFDKKFKEIISTLPQLKLVAICNTGDFLPLVKKTVVKLRSKRLKGKITYLKGKTVIDFHDILKKYSKNPVDVEIDLDDLAIIQYTGGTTGLPKGAMLTHANVISNLIIASKWLGWEKGKDIACSGFPLFHIAGLFFCEICLFNGTTQVLIHDARDIDYICDLLKKYEPSIQIHVPALYQMLLNNRSFKKINFSRLKYCVSSAAPFPVESQKKLETIIGKGKLLEGYGMTETSPVLTLNPLKGEKKLGTIGLPIPNTELRLVDLETGEDVSIGNAGEIWVRGPQVMQGYYNKPAETANTIDNDGFLHTGDIAIMDEDGYLKIVGRSKDMIIVSGYKVFSKKVEDTIYRHPSIEKIAIMGIPNPERPGSELVKAYIKLDPEYEHGGNLKALKKEIISFTKERCSPYEVPKIIEFVENFPQTPDGKIDKKKLEINNL